MTALRATLMTFDMSECWAQHVPRMHISVFLVIFYLSSVMSQVLIDVTKVTLISITPAASNSASAESQAFIGYSTVSELSAC
jgi:hypothetical protein